MNKLKKWVNDVFTEPNSSTICPVRVLAFLGFLYAVGTHAWTIYVLKAAFDLQAFGIAFGAMLATLGAALGLKTDSPHD